MSEKSITSGQREKLHEMVRAVTDGVLDSMERKGELTRKGVETVRRSGGEFRAMVGDAVREALVRLSVAQDFADEEVISTYGYLFGYRSLKPIAEQARILQEYFPKELANATYSQQAVDQALQDAQAGSGPEGPFALIPWRLLAKTYGEALERVLAVLGKTRGGKFVNYRQGQLGPDRLRQGAKKAEALERIASTQGGYDVLVIAGQFGIRHRGRSVRRACAVMENSEFGMGAFEVAIMLLTHPERLALYNDLWIDCAGDEYSAQTDGHFGRAPYFRFDDGHLKFGTVGVPYVDDYHGSASGFLPQ